MTPEEVHVRSLYLFLACSRAIEEGCSRLREAATGATTSVQAALEKALKKELALLFRYWATRKIWERWESQELEAKVLNLALLRLFYEGFRLPKDGSGMRYAELSTVNDEAQELTHRVANALGINHVPLTQALERSVLTWRDAVMQYTVEALTRSEPELSVAIKAWAVAGPAASQ